MHDAVLRGRLARMDLLDQRARDGFGRQDCQSRIVSVTSHDKAVGCAQHAHERRKERVVRVCHEDALRLRIVRVLAREDRHHDVERAHDLGEHDEDGGLANPGLGRDEDVAGLREDLRQRVHEDWVVGDGGDDLDVLLRSRRRGVQDLDGAVHVHPSVVGASDHAPLFDALGAEHAACDSVLGRDHDAEDALDLLVDAGGGLLGGTRVRGEATHVAFPHEAHRHGEVGVHVDEEAREGGRVVDHVEWAMGSQAA